MLAVALAILLFVVIGLGVGLAWSRPRAATTMHWVCSREGLVRFAPEAVVLHAWDGVQGTEPRNGGVAVRLHHDLRPDFFAMKAEATVTAYLQDLERRFETDGAHLWIPNPMMAGEKPENFVAALQRAVGDPESRRDLPTFYQPDGPPEAVLSGVE